MTYANCGMKIKMSPKICMPNKISSFQNKGKAKIFQDKGKHVFANTCFTNSTEILLSGQKEMTPASNSNP